MNPTNRVALYSALFAGFVLLGSACKPKPAPCTGPNCNITNNSCDPDAGVGSAGVVCAAAHRTCSAADGGSCGGCISGYQDFAGDCEVPTTCAQLDCAATNRNCSDTPNGHCTTCLQGFVQDEGTDPCRVPLTCQQVNCPTGLNCIQPVGVQDAYCSSGCGSSAIPTDAGICIGCPACNNAAIGENGPDLTGVTGENKCICKTLPGFFWQTGLFPGVTPCDADGDGWVRESAKIAL